MEDEVNQYEQFRLKRLQKQREQDNLSAHFSYKESFPNFSDRPQSNSARSSPEEITNSLHQQLSIQRQQYQELKNQHIKLEQEHLNLLQDYSTLQKRFAKSQSQRENLKKELASRTERDRGTKTKLKQWVSQARQNLGDH